MPGERGGEHGILDEASAALFVGGLQPEVSFNGASWGALGFDIMSGKCAKADDAPSQRRHVLSIDHPPSEGLTTAQRGVEVDRARKAHEPREGSDGRKGKPPALVLPFPVKRFISDAPVPARMRAFVGVPVPPERELVTLLDRLAALRADLKVVDPANLHLTLAFLGEVADARAPDLAEAVRRATRKHAPFTTGLAGVGAFPNARHPRVVWVGATEAQKLTGLALAVRDEIAAAGLVEDGKDFRAHVTVARTRSERSMDDLVRFLQSHGRDEFPDLSVREARVYRSVLGPSGPAYETLAALPLEA